MSSRKLLASPLPPTPKRKQRCRTCEQVYCKTEDACPHCRTGFGVQLTAFVFDCSEESFDAEKKYLPGGANDKPLKYEGSLDTREEMIHSLFLRAMELRYKDPKRSRDLFREVVTMEPNHYEARLKVSWHEIRMGLCDGIPALLEPIVLSNKSTLEQKQRAYNNLACACLVGKVIDPVTAEKWALKGIALNEGTGTPKLWENLGGAYKDQGRFRESVDAFTKALLMDPKSKHAKRSVKVVEKEMKLKGSKPAKKPKEEKPSKKKKAEMYDLNTEEKENAPINTIQRSQSSASFFKKQKSEKSLGKVIHC